MVSNIRNIVGLVLLLLVTSGVAAAERPNILFILTDQHHARMLSSAGSVPEDSGARFYSQVGEYLM